MALAWLGPTTNAIEGRAELRAEPSRAYRARTTHTADYLLGMPLLSDQLEETLSLLGQSCEDFEADRL